MIVTIKTVPEARVGLVGRSTARHRVRDSRPIDEKQIEPPVIVVVEHGNAGAHRLRKIFLTGPAGRMFETNAGSCRDVFEQWRGRLRRQRSSQPLDGGNGR